jgi:regulator of protease activity HflC (stomatin/prohibitin superfamily)
MIKPQNKEELASTALEVATEALNALDMSIKSQDCSIRDLNSILSTCSKVYREIKNDIAAEQKATQVEEEENKEEVLGQTIQKLLSDVNQAGK